MLRISHTHTITATSFAANTFRLHNDGILFFGQLVAANCANGITFTVTIKDEDGNILFNEAALAENNNTTFFAAPKTDDYAPVVARGSVTITPSGDPGGAGTEYAIVCNLYVMENQYI